MYAAAAVLDGKIYVVGGIAKQNVLKSVERYDPETNRWTDVGHLKNARAHHHCCTVNGSIYAVGGRDGPKMLTSIEKFDEQLNQWTVVRQKKKSHVSLQAALNIKLIY